jgi:3-oxoacyl-[acyl-carrier-protein] synthase-3
VIPVSPISLIGTASYLPERVVGNDFFGGADSASPMFKGARLRHHVGPGESATDMIVRATERLATRCDLDPRIDIDLVLTNVSVPDLPFTGCGAAVVRRLGCEPRFVLDLHNTGCISFVFMLKLAQSLMASTGARSALLCNVQTAAGRVFADPGNVHRPQAAIPGDGCGVAYVVAGTESPVKSIAVRTCPDFADDMQIRCDTGGEYWAARQGPMYIDFDESRVATIVSRGNRLVPDVIREACRSAELAVGDIDVLVTNQPNPVFLRNWRESLQLPEASHVHTFAEHGNLFGAGIPISLERAADEGKLRPGSHVVVGGFSHAGDYAAAAVIQWRPGGAA